MTAARDRSPPDRYGPILIESLEGAQSPGAVDRGGTPNLELRTLTSVQRVSVSHRAGSTGNQTETLAALDSWWSNIGEGLADRNF